MMDMSTIELPDDVAAALAAAASKRGATVAELISEMISEREPDALVAFLGCGASGRTDPLDLHDERHQASAGRSASNT